MKDALLCVTITVCSAVFLGVYSGIQLKSVVAGIFFSLLLVGIMVIVALVAWIEKNA